MPCARHKRHLILPRTLLITDKESNFRDTESFAGNDCDSGCVKVFDPYCQTVFWFQTALGTNSKRVPSGKPSTEERLQHLLWGTIPMLSQTVHVYLSQTFVVVCLPHGLVTV